LAVEEGDGGVGDLEAATGVRLGGQVGAIVVGGGAADQTCEVAVIVCDCSFGELAWGEIGDLDFEVKWSCPCEEFCPGRDGCILEVEIMTAEELLERYAAGERDFSGIKFERSIDLEDAQIPGINLSNSTMVRANLTDTNLSGANLSGANLGSSCLENTKLKRANLSRTILSNSTLVGADLTGADLTGADLMACGLANINLTNAKVINTWFGDEVGLYGANLTNVDLSQANIHLPEGIEEPSIEGAILNNTILPDGTKVTFI
jgi:uncharacterized protein YjbI with pentapeptide repeats